jgi:hypothetical protein
MVYLVAYLWVIDAQDDAIAWWYVVLMVLAALSFAVAAIGRWARAALTVGLVTSAVAMLVALLSLGALLAPTVVAAAIALVVTRPGADSPAATGTTTESAARGSRWPFRLRVGQRNIGVRQLAFRSGRAGLASVSGSRRPAAGYL